MSLLKQLIKQYGFALLLCIIALVTMDYIFGSVSLSVIFFGIPCPACGITRATKLMLLGRFKESFQMHPLLILVIIGVILYPILKKLLKNYRLFIKWYAIICIIIFICFYIYRMLVYFPNVEPMVYREDNFLAKVLEFIRFLKQ